VAPRASGRTGRHPYDGLVTPTSPLADLLARLQAALADRYTIERELGRGGMATVYLAQDLKHNRKVAIKVLKPELAAALGPERFSRRSKSRRASRTRTSCRSTFGRSHGSAVLRDALRRRRDAAESSRPRRPLAARPSGADLARVCDARQSTLPTPPWSHARFSRTSCRGGMRSDGFGSRGDHRRVDKS